MKKLVQKRHGRIFPSHYQLFLNKVLNFYVYYSVKLLMK